MRLVLVSCAAPGFPIPSYDGVCSSSKSRSSGEKHAVDDDENDDRANEYSDNSESRARLVRQQHSTGGDAAFPPSFSAAM